MTRRYLVTGAQGFVGRHLAARILETVEDAEVVGIGRSASVEGFFSGGRPLPEELRALPAHQYRYEPMSLLDTEKLRSLVREVRPRCIFHLASALHSATERELVETNVEGTSSLLKAVAQAQGADALVVLGSSGSVYGEPTSLPIREADACNPADLYGVTKLAAEHLTRIAARKAGFSFVVGRIFNVVGPGLSDSHVCARVASQLATAREARNPRLEVGALDPTRDFIDVRDVAAALVLLADRAERGGTYNVATGRETQIQLVLSELLGISGFRDRIELARRNEVPSGVRRHVADVSRLAGLGFVPSFPLRQSLEDLYRYHLALAEPRAGAQAELRETQDR